LGICSPVDSTARCRIPTSTPTALACLLEMGDLPGDLAGEGDIPAVGGAGDGGRQNAAGVVLEVAGELAG